MKDDRVYLAHILRCISRIEEYTREGRDSFSSSYLIQDGVIRNLQTLAESSQRLSDAVKGRYPLRVGFRREAPPEHGEDHPVHERGAGRLEEAAPSVRALDTTGAGDAFNAGFLAGVLCGLPPRRSLRLGNGVGAR